MNCSCGLPVVSRESRKPESLGKTFFACGAGKCNFFVWAGGANYGPMPVNIEPLYKNSTKAVSPSTSKKRKIVVKFQLFRIVDAPTFRVWFMVLHSYDKAVVDFYGKLPAGMKHYDEARKLWTFDLAIYQDIVSNLSSSDFAQYVELLELPKFLAVGLRKYAADLSRVSSALPDSIQLNVQPALLAMMKGFQIEGVKYVIRHNGRALIGDEMGCGKTIQAIACMQHYREHWPVLILMPPTLITQWKDELLKFCSETLREKDICVVRKASDFTGGTVCLVPYSILQSLTDGNKIRHEQFGIVICDESHNLKSKDAIRTNLAVPFLKKATIALCLSGTPATNRPVELYTQLNALLPKVFSDYDQFTRRYCDAKQSHFQKGLDVRGSSNPDELKLLLEGLVMIRRLKSDVVNDLPSKQREVRYINADPCYLPEIIRLRKESDELQARMNDPRNDTAMLKRIKTEQQMNMIAQYQVCGLSKIPEVVEEVKKLIQESLAVKPPASSSRVDVVIDLTEAAEDEDDLLFAEKCPVNVAPLCKSELVDSDDSYSMPARSSGRLKRKSSQSSSRKTAALSDSDDDDILFKDRNSTARKSAKSKTAESPPEEAYESDTDEAAMAWKRLLNGKKGESKKKAQSSGAKSALTHKFLVFAHHKAVMDAIEDCFRDCCVTYIRVDGDVTQSRRDTFIKQFQEDDKTQIALLSTTACGTGLNLTRASVAVFAELSWSHGSILQAEDRIHRLGQESDLVRVIYLLARNTSDEIMFEQMQKKHNVLAATVGMAEKRGGGMNAKSSLVAASDLQAGQGTLMEMLQGETVKSSAPAIPPMPYGKSLTSTTIDSFFGKAVQQESPKIDVPVVVPPPPPQLQSEIKAVPGFDQFVYSAPSIHSQPDIENAIVNLVQPAAKVAPVGPKFQPFKVPSRAVEPVPLNIPPAPLPVQQPTHPAQVYKLDIHHAPIISTQAPEQAPSKQPLSPGTKARIEHNKLLALERLKARSAVPPAAPLYVEPVRPVFAVPAAAKTFSMSAFSTNTSAEMKSELSYIPRAVAASTETSFNFTSGKGNVISVPGEAIENASVIFKGLGTDSSACVTGTTTSFKPQSNKLVTKSGRSID